MIPEQRELLAWQQANIDDMLAMQKRLVPEAASYQTDVIMLAIEIQRWGG